MNLNTCNLDPADVVAEAQAAFTAGAIDEHSTSCAVLRAILKRRPEWRGFSPADGESLTVLGPGAWTEVPDLSNTRGAIRHLDGSRFLPLGRQPS